MLWLMENKKGLRQDWEEREEGRGIISSRAKKQTISSTNEPPIRLKDWPSKGMGREEEEEGEGISVPSRAKAGKEKSFNLSSMSKSYQCLIYVSSETM